MTKQQQDASYVAGVIRAFLDGSGRAWEWDDFTSCSLPDDRLDSIRRRAGAVQLPLAEDQRITLDRLADEAEQLARM